MPFTVIQSAGESNIHTRNSNMLARQIQDGSANRLFIYPRSILDVHRLPLRAHSAHHFISLDPQENEGANTHQQQQCGRQRGNGVRGARKARDRSDLSSALLGLAASGSTYWEGELESCELRHTAVVGVTTSASIPHISI